MPTDLLPRLLVHTVAGDFTLDPWAPGGLDLAQYGITAYQLRFDAQTRRFVADLTFEDATTVTVDPFGPPVDLSARGIFGYEVVWGPQAATDLRTLLAGGKVAAAVLVAGLAWLWGRRKP